jgi:hypothetical protein
MPNPLPKSAPIDRPLPKSIRYTTRGFVYCDFELMDRIKMLFGYRILLEIQIASEHNPGTTQPTTKWHLTTQTTLAKAVLELRETVTNEQAAKGVQANKLPEGGAK